MKYFLSFFGIVLSFFMMKYRESIGDMFTEPDWLRDFGGIYNLVIFLAFFIFIWSIATITGTDQILFTPVTWIIPGLRPPPPTVQ